MIHYIFAHVTYIFARCLQIVGSSRYGGTSSTSQLIAFKDLNSSLVSSQLSLMLWSLVCSSSIVCEMTFPTLITCSVASPWSSHFNVKARSTQDKKDNSIYNIYIYISSFEFLFFSSCCFSLFYRKVTSFLKLYSFPTIAFIFTKKTTVNIFYLPTHQRALHEERWSMHFPGGSPSKDPKNYNCRKYCS